MGGPRETFHRMLARLGFTLRYQSASHWLKWLFGLVVQLLVACSFMGELAWQQGLDARSFSDAWLYSFLGAQAQAAAEDEATGFPLLWVVFQSYILFVLADFVPEGLSGFGMQGYLRAGTRASWLGVMCLVEALAVVAYYVQYALALLVCQSATVGVPYAGSTVDGGIYLLLPVCVTVALVLLQTLLGLVLSPRLAYVAVEGALVLAVFLSPPPLIAQYGMLVRARVCDADGFGAPEALAACGMLAVGATALAFLRMRSFDVVVKDDEQRWK